MSTDAVPTSSASEGVLIRACRGESVPYVPVWFMRQAGRSLPEYRALREGIAMLDACARPDMIVEITLQPVRRHGVDAAILFSDIVLPLKATGVDLDIVPGTGPVVAEPFGTLADVDRLRPLEPDDMPYIADAVRGLVAELGATPLIGFAGAPFTLASYLIEGGPSRDHARTKALMRSEPAVWHALLDRLGELSAGFLRLQVDAGARAVQLFDSWAGTLSAADYATYVQPHSARVLAAIDGVPRIHFGVGTGEILPLMGAAGADVVGVDWRVPLDAAAQRLGGRHALQGNLDPTVLMAPTEVVEAEATRVLDAGRSAPGHVFNLGHGVLPSTDPDALTRLVDFVHVSSG